MTRTCSPLAQVAISNIVFKPDWKLQFRYFLRVLIYTPVVQAAAQKPKLFAESNKVLLRPDIFEQEFEQENNAAYWWPEGFRQTVGHLPRQ